MSTSDDKKGNGKGNEKWPEPKTGNEPESKAEEKGISQRTLELPEDKKRKLFSVLTSVLPQKDLSNDAKLKIFLDELEKELG